MSERTDDQTPGPTGPGGDEVPGASRGSCAECGSPLAADQRYCLGCGARRGRLPEAVAGTVAGRRAAGTGGGAGGPGFAAGGGGRGGAGSAGKGGAWSWIPSPPAIAIAVIGMLALGVGLGSAMSEIASSAPLSTILLELPGRATEAPPAEEPEEEEETAEAGPELAEAPAATPEEFLAEAPLPEEVVEEAPLPPEEATEEPQLVPFNPEEGEEENPFEEGTLPEVKHAFLIMLGEGGYDETFGAASASPYLSRVLPKKGELVPNYYGVTSGVLANEIALLSGQGPTPETAANCPNYDPIAPGTVSIFGEQVEGDGCVYGEEVKSLPSELTEQEVSWRAYVQGMEDGGAIGQPWRCRKPTLGAPDTTVPTAGDQYATWRNPVVYFSAIAAGAECEKHDVGFEVLSKDLAAKKKTPALSLIFPDVCHAGGEVECEPGAPKGAQGVAAELKTLVPAIMASPAYEERGLILITSAQAPQSGEHLDQRACCLAPEYPNLPPPPAAEVEESPLERAATSYTEESVRETGGGGKVGLLMISPMVEPGKVEEAEYANHFTLSKTLARMLGVEPTGYAAEEGVPTLGPGLFVAEAGEEESTGPVTQARRKRRPASPGSAVVPPAPTRVPKVPTRRPSRARGAGDG
ncbi:MAG TPA: alkaline phosphatase family protein [Solirubrobacterales bacterium]|nr:alkaline phosphatase family protein [Solirubrobacterales bacterium]